MRRTLFGTVLYSALYMPPLVVTTGFLCFKRREAGFHVSHLPEELSRTFPLSSGLLCNHCVEQALSSC